MTTAIMILGGEYFAWKVDTMKCWIERTDYLEPNKWWKRLLYKIFPPREEHYIIAKGNKIERIEAMW